MQEDLEIRFQRAFDLQSEAVQLDFRRRLDMAKAVAKLAAPIWENLDVNSIDLKDLKTSKVPAIAKVCFYVSFFASAFFSWIGEQLGAKSIVWPYIVGPAVLMAIALLGIVFYALIELFLERKIRQQQQLQSNLLLHWLSDGATIECFWELRALSLVLLEWETKLTKAWTSCSPEEDQVRENYCAKEAGIVDHWRKIRIELLERSSGVRIAI